MRTLEYELVCNVLGWRPKIAFKVYYGVYRLIHLTYYLRGERYPFILEDVGYILICGYSSCKLVETLIVSSSAVLYRAASLLEKSKLGRCFGIACGGVKISLAEVKQLGSRALGNSGDFFIVFYLYIICSFKA